MVRVGFKLVNGIFEHTTESGTDSVHAKYDQAKYPTKGKASNRLSYARIRYKAKGVVLDGFKPVNGIIEYTMESGTECVYEKRQPARGKASNRLTYARAKYKAKEWFWMASS